MYLPVNVGKYSGIHFWTNVPSPHLLPLAEALTNSFVQVTITAGEELSADRIRLGWQRPRPRRVRVELRPPDAVCPECVSPSELHVLCGIRPPSLGAAVLAILNSRFRWGIMAEGCDPRGPHGRIRRAIYHHALKKRAPDFVLAMGRTGVEWFLSCGADPRVVFEYGYSVDFPSYQPHLSRASPDGLRITYVGALIRLKRVGDLIAALPQVSPPEWCCDIVGDGPLRHQLTSNAHRLDLDYRVRFKGVKTMAEVRDSLQESDVLVLPSAHDGWGVVVNEALMSGVQVICTTRCGAATLIRTPLQGATFECGNCKQLTALLSDRVVARENIRAVRADLARWAVCVSPHAMGVYLTNLLGHVYTGAQKPAPPWTVPASEARP